MIGISSRSPRALSPRLVPTMPLRATQCEPTFSSHSTRTLQILWAGSGILQQSRTQPFCLFQSSYNVACHVSYFTRRLSQEAPLDTELKRLDRNLAAVSDGKLQ